MEPDLDSILYFFSAGLLGILAGAYAAIQPLSYTRSDKNADDGSRPGWADRLIENAVPNYFSLGLGRMLGLAAVAVTSARLAVHHLRADSVFSQVALLFVLGSVFVPVALAHAVASRAPARYIEVLRFVVFPAIYVLKPGASLFIAVLRKAAPALLEVLSLPALPLKRRIERFGYQNGDEATGEQNLMSSVIEFGDTKVREVMVPRIDMVAINVQMDSAEALDVVVEAGHSRIPVFDETIDRIVGVIHTKDLLKRTVYNEEISLADLRRDAYFVPESKKIDELLAEFRKRRIHIAIVVDEYGGTAGLITLEDVLEEIVGDIQDEFDAEEELIRRLDDGSAMCNSRVRLDDLSEALGFDLPSGDVETLGGFLYEIIGRVPRVGETVRHGVVEFTVDSVVRQRIEKVRVRTIEADDARARDGAA